MSGPRVWRWFSWVGGLVLILAGVLGLTQVLTAPGGADEAVWLGGWRLAAGVAVLLGAWWMGNRRRADADRPRRGGPRVARNPGPARAGPGLDPRPGPGPGGLAIGPRRRLAPADQLHAAAGRHHPAGLEPVGSPGGGGGPPHGGLDGAAGTQRARAGDGAGRRPGPGRALGDLVRWLAADPLGLAGC